jgi:hydroxyacylglutathione hydrolase
MQPIEIMKDLFFIERGYLNGNHFVHRSEDPVLIDTAYIADFNDTERLIAAMGVDLQTVRLIVNTHTHCDHIGGNRLIQERSGCDIALHRVGKHFIDTRDDWATWWRYYHQEAEFFDGTICLDHGETIAVGPHEFEVIHTPGHAADGIVLYGKKEKVLISSDTLWEKDLAVMTLRVEGSLALFHMQESLEKLEPLDVRLVCPGHGKPFTDMASALGKSKQKIASYLNNREQIGLDLLKKIIVYTLLMRQPVKEETFYSDLMATPWFPETAALYFNGECEKMYADIIDGFLKRGIVERQDSQFVTTIKP